MQHVVRQREGDAHNIKQTFFTISVNGLEIEDSGDYWCSVKKKGISKGVHMELRVNASSSYLWTNTSLIIGQAGEAVTAHCYYNQEYKDHLKSWCKGTSWSSCVGVPAGENMSFTDDFIHRTFIMNINNVEEGDSGQYWCTAEQYGVKVGISLEIKIKDGAVKQNSAIQCIAKNSFCWQFWVVWAFVDGLC
ncbi:CMRF35-like molecule 1 [Polypterus senegalus]|uniref:CMRF35-like molecule 1 n=1 Tax=Polypterus senegalus TaxID=55291 RepID=UPI0019651549|nr:CMRF35-like molecule 1 [Polypterus senegalus]